MIWLGHGCVMSFQLCPADASACAYVRIRPGVFCRYGKCNTVRRVVQQCAPCPTGVGGFNFEGKRGCRRVATVIGGASSLHLGKMRNGWDKHF